MLLLIVFQVRKVPNYQLPITNCQLTITNYIMKKKQELHQDLRSVFDELQKFRKTHPEAWRVINKHLTKNGVTTLTDADAALFYALEMIEETDFDN
jgi:DNA-binding ferritin-like protein (Dps family)